jgi:small nuclear ribonucleoprotein (snRNP)-like protein
MSNSKRLMICVGLITSFLFSSVTLLAQNTTSTGDWASLQNIPADSKVSVKLKTGKTVDGRFKSVSDSSLTLTSNYAPVELKREEIASVYQITKKSATKSTLIGMGLGAGGGAAIGAAAAAKDDNGFDKIDHVATAALAVVGAVGGAVTGYLLGRGSKRVLVYESK